MEAEDFDIDLTQFSEEDEKFLEAVHENSDDLGRSNSMATTTEIRRDTDLTRSQIHYRIEKFKDSGLLKVEKPEGHSGNAPKEFRLTRGGADALNEGVFSDLTDPKNTMAALAEHVKTLQARLEAVEVNTETDSTRVFTERQRQAIDYYVDEKVSIDRRSEERFWWEIFPTIAAELGYPRPSGAPAGDKYLKNFEYSMNDLATKEPTSPDPDEPTLAERVERLEEKVDELAATIDGGAAPDTVAADDD